MEIVCFAFWCFFFAQNFFVKKKNELAWNCPNNPIYNTTAQNLLLASIFHAFIGPCGHLRDLLRYKNDHWFLSVTLNWICNYKCQTKVFWVAKWYLVVIIKLPYSRNTTAFSALVAQALACFHVFLKLLRNEWETLKLLKWLSKAIY